MVISELVAALEAIWAEHGDVEVMHEMVGWILVQPRTDDEKSEPYFVEEAIFYDGVDFDKRTEEWEDQPYVCLVGKRHTPLPSSAGDCRWLRRRRSVTDMK